MENSSKVFLQNSPPKIFDRVLNTPLHKINVNLITFKLVNQIDNFKQQFHFVYKSMEAFALHLRNF